MGLDIFLKLFFSSLYIKKYKRFTMKRKQPDFQKVKFKVGKHLPKGRNETKTSFQTRKILVPTQLKAVNVEPT
ncbi:hypothetical protein CEXT_406301 [Caerostris extrusa]|uniref:Uncharacterized protein n=1 Tax=Caerostris extrusa TaxID=172846 RepID=A0AAV4XZZ5_CAEEX|nr:hypothetical protein CEXT_406301 [Caerostris extrusa]